MEPIEITKLDNKYLVFKWEDIQNLPLDIKEKVAFVQGYIETFRHGKGKKDNKYLVLNLEDEFDVIDLRRSLYNKDSMYENKIKNIAVDLVNAILKAKENK